MSQSYERDILLKLSESFVLSFCAENCNNFHCLLLLVCTLVLLYYRINHVTWCYLALYSFVSVHSRYAPQDTVAG